MGHSQYTDTAQWQALPQSPAQKAVHDLPGICSYVANLYLCIRALPATTGNPELQGHIHDY